MRNCWIILRDDGYCYRFTLDDYNRFAHNGATLFSNHDEATRTLDTIAHGDAKRCRVMMLQATEILMPVTLAP